jgi:Zn-dependent protease with chaperone function
LDYSSGVNAYATATNGQVHVSISLAELFADSESELAFVMGHALGHLIQSKIGMVFSPSSAEADADQHALLLTMLAGYDPYGSAGALGKLAVASANASFLSPTFDNQASGVDLHALLSNRLSQTYLNMNALCAYNADFQTFCTEIKGLTHPHFPGSAPLSVRPPALPRFRLPVR